MRDAQRRALAFVGLAALAAVLAAQRSPRARAQAQVAPSSAAWDAALAGARQVDVNTADASQLERLPGVGPALARRIVAEREAHGPFAHPRDVTRVKGIGSQTARALEPYVRTVEE